MIVQALKLRAVRNLAPVQLTPGPHFNVLAGDNGQGKTNVLEAIYVAGTLRSFRTQRLADLIAFDAADAFVGARVHRGGLERTYELTITPRARTVRLDGKAVRPIARYFGDFNVVLFAPEDLRVIRGSPADRRRFLDRAVFNSTARHLVDTQAYDKIIRNRNALLKQIHERPGANQDLLDVYDQQAADLGARLVVARRRYLDELTPHFARAFAAITHSGWHAALRYVTEPDIDAAGTDEPTVCRALAAAHGAARARDQARGATSTGPHRDDLAFQLEGRPAAAFASQGQLRAIVLAWKTAEMDLLARHHGDPPVLLLDDVSSELDSARNGYLFEFLRARDHQCFITTTHPKHVLVSDDRCDYTVSNGSLLLEN